MNKRLTAVAVCGLVGVLSVTARAMPPGMGGPMGRGRPAKTDLAAIHKDLIAALKLTDKQAPAVEKILADFRKDVGAWDAKTSPEVSRLNMRLKMYHRVKDPKAVAAVKSAVARLAQIREERKAKDIAMMARLKGVLTEPQLAQAKEALSPRKAVSPSTSKFHLLSQVGLTEAQKVQLGKIMADLRAQEAKGGNPKVLTQKVWTRIINEVLTNANREKLRDVMQEASFRRMSRAMLGNIELTREQIAKIDVVWKVAHKKALANVKDKFGIYGRAQEEIIKDVLTDAQREQIRSRSQGRGGSRTGHGHRHSTTKPKPTFRTDK